MIRNNEQKLINDGWSLGETRLSFSTSDIFIYASNSEGVSCVELQIKFNVGKNMYKDIEKRISVIQNTLNLFKDNIDELKISMDVNYSLQKDVTIKESEIVSVFKGLDFEKLQNVKGKYRKFKIMNKHNITEQFQLVKQNDKHFILDISIGVDNIVVDYTNIKEEIEFSLYYYIIEYAKFHYNILKILDCGYLLSQQEFYEKLEKEF